MSDEKEALQKQLNLILKTVEPLRKDSYVGITMEHANALGLKPGDEDVAKQTRTHWARGRQVKQEQTVVHVLVADILTATKSAPKPTPTPTPNPTPTPTPTPSARN